MNGGNHTRANTEDVLIATRGAGLERKHAGIKQVVYSPLGALAKTVGSSPPHGTALRRRAAD